MRIKFSIVLLLVFSISNLFGKNQAVQQQTRTTTLQTVTLYPPQDKATDKYDETRACFSFKLGKNKLPKSPDWDLGYGFMTIGEDEWLEVGGAQKDKRSVMKGFGQHTWSDTFRIRPLEPLPELKNGEQRSVVVDASGDNYEQWSATTTRFAVARTGYMYVLHVKDAEADMYVEFRIEELLKEDHCTISWKQIPPPDNDWSTAVNPQKEGIKFAKLLKRKTENGVDNYPYATFNFSLGGNGPEIQKECLNRWDMIFGNSSPSDAFDVSVASGSRSRIRDLGLLDWDDKYPVERLPVYEERVREPAMKAIEGHLYLVHFRDKDTDDNFYTLFRVEKLEPGKSVDISWKIIPTPKQR